MMKTGMLPILALTILAASSTRAKDNCDVPIGNWKSRDAVRAMAEERGWTLKRIKIDDGCYEVYGIDKDGRRFEAKINPATLEIIKTEERRNHR